ncbi:MAG: hypothetical protein AAGE84_14775 [Cyanobacteria bacterium P01_G01_bin.39]
MVTVPSNPSIPELASMSLVPFPLTALPSAIPNKDSALIVILPPCPCCELAKISLLPLGKATIKLVLISIFPPVLGVVSLPANIPV